jgi:ferredoxin
MRPFRKAGTGVPGKSLVAGAKPTRRESVPGKPGAIVLATGSELGTCINCPDTPCVNFRENEITSPVLTSFPFNRTKEVCPFGALTADTSKLVPIINDAACIGCGLCVSRCPSNALYANTRGTVSLNDAENGAFKTRAAADPASHVDTVKRLDAAPRSGTIRPISLESLDTVMGKITAAALHNTNQKLLARNLLLCLGANAATSTVGDSNLRIDMWWET